ncbi:MAG: sugar transport ATP-hydrolyzing [Deltaproteobacteria bacterium]|nr:sugar transport ATP-hydrolyzing [Deltaproteobacteria bacterium]
MKLSFRDVSKTFRSLRGAVPAVRGVDFSVEDGELFVLLGPSGCGKSTILNLAAGLERPTSGEIRFDGEIVASLEGRVFVPPGERNVAMVFQGYALRRGARGDRPLGRPDRFHARHRGPAPFQAVGTFRRAAAAGGHRQGAGPQPAALSPRRATLQPGRGAPHRDAGRAAPPPTVPGRSLEVTTLYVTHDQTEAMTLGDRIALLRDGRILQTGTPRDLYEKPQTPFAASFIGPYTMNLLKTDLEEEGGVCSIRIGTERLPLPPDRASGARRLGSRKILFGIRPEHARAHPDSPDPGLRGIVTAVEHLGRETLVTADLGGASLRAIAGEGTLKEGDATRIAIPIDSIHVFPD